MRRGGVRARLIALIAGLLVAALGVTGFFVYRGTGAQVGRAIDDDLRQDAGAFSTQAVPRRAQRPATIVASVRRYLATQPAFGESARLFVVRVSEGPIVTNEPELVGRRDRDQSNESVQQRAREAADAGEIRTAPLGYTTFNLTEAGTLRLLTRPIVRSGRTVATLSVGETLASVRRAQQGVINALLLAGSLTLAAAILLGAALAARIVQPLRRMARTAARVDAGDLAPRIHAQGPPDEIHVLADAFDHMLDRLEDAFARQRGFVADASHELRTPLTVIRGQLEVLSRQAAPSAEEVRRTERIARTELVRMERLVDDLLLLARADEGALVHAQDIELEPFVHHFFESLTTTADRRFELTGEAEGTLYADPDRVAQALHNLARNAIQHTTEGGLVRLRVTTEKKHVELAIEDDGPGIPQSERTRVFDRFHRAEARRRSGSGLGLSIVRAIADAHHGSVTASDSPEGGARVSIVLPGWRHEAPTRTRDIATSVGRDRSPDVRAGGRGSGVSS
jgi:two-component system OmpR family sensor kinase